MNPRRLIFKTEARLEQNRNETRMILDIGYLLILLPILLVSHFLVFLGKATNTYREREGI